jgi:hypothetical protein
MSSELVLRPHSPLGGSAAERFINCPGSVRLAEKMRPGLLSVEPDYTRHGIAAHKMVAYCLGNYLDAWEAMDKDWGCVFAPDEIRSIQSFIDLVRRRIDVFKSAYGGQSPTILIEFPIHEPALHELFYGTLDVGIVAGDEGEIIDYKHGAGIAVDAENNPQLMYYGVGFAQSMPELRKIRLRIGQPRAYHPDGPDRSWELSVEDLMQWYDKTLQPAMERADPRSGAWYSDGVEVDPGLNPGEWCRFCPVKRQCPALENQILDLVGTVVEMQSNDTVGRLYQMIPSVKMKIKAIEDEVTRRNFADPTNLIPGSKIVTSKSNRVWKDGADIEAAKVFGTAAFEPAHLKSPYALEQEFGNKAKQLTKLHAYSADAGYTTAPVSDKRKAVSLQKPVEAYQGYLEQQ